ncbi:MAG TPA: EI24 domain-containing protein [Kofleriaceae bacterium]|nr:EI24 domain-containing protein [Kofleriaceae bacterium]
MIEVLRGARDVGRGGKLLLAHPRLWIWVIAPAVITLLLVAAIIWGVVRLSDPAVAWVAARLPDFLAGWVSGLLRVVVIGGLALAGFVVFVSLAGVLAGPFCEILSERVEEQVTGRAAPGTSIAGFVRGLVTGLVHAVRRLLVYLVGLALVFVLAAAVPVIGAVVAAAVGAYLSATSAAYDCFDAVFARRLWPYRRKVEFLRVHRGRSLGLGGATAALLLVPGLNLLALGVGATGATLAALELESAPRARG